jgi:hypothetical protein
MARPRQDGLPSKAPSKRKLTDQFIKSMISDKGRSLTWDTKVPGLSIAAYPSNKKVFKVVYPFNGRTRWYTVGKYGAIDLDNARALAATVVLKVATNIDPQAEKISQRSAGTFEELAQRYADYTKTKE